MSYSPSFGNPIISEPTIDNAPSNCILLASPNSLVQHVGRVNSFMLFSEAAGRQFYAQTYRRTGTGYVLKGSYLATTAAAGVTTIAVPTPWDVIPGGQSMGKVGRRNTSNA